MWDNPIKTIEDGSTNTTNESFAGETMIVHHLRLDESLEYIKWMVAGTLLGIFVIMTIVISAVTCMDIRRAEKQIEKEIFEDDESELKVFRRDPFDKR